MKLKTMKSRFAMLLCAGLVLSISSTCVAQKIVLKNDVIVTGNLVHLQDIADIHGASDLQHQVLSALPLFPMSSDSVTIAATKVGEELQAAGVDLLFWQMSGARSIRIRKAPSTAVRRMQAAEARLAKNDPRPQMTPAQQKVSGRNRRLRSVSTVTSKKTAMTTAVWGAGENIPGGTQLTQQMLIRLDISSKVDPYVRDARKLIGQVAKYNLRKGRPIRSGSTRAVHYVNRNKPVVLVSTIGRISVKTNARCLADGTLGDILQVVSLDGKKRFEAKVIGHGEVQVLGAAGDRNFRKTSRR